MVDRIADPWGPRTPYGSGQEWPVRVDTFLDGDLNAEDVDRWVQSASILHSNGDALDIAVRDGRIVGVRGRAVDRVNRGRVDPKDLYGWQANNSPDRLTRPLVREGGRLVETDWDTAMGRIVARSKELLEGPGGWGHFGFYTSGQLFLEEYYTLGVIGKAGLGTPHMDGNTRLCTATAAAALKATFGADGQPGSYADVDHCDAIAIWGHNVAETQTVLWMRMLDRRRGPNPPALLAVDPRSTAVTREADLHLPIRNGTNMALLNGLLREVIQHGWYDEAYVDAHTLGFDELCRTVDGYPPELVADICDIPAADVRRAAELLGGSQRLLSTVLQGFYQSNQATAASCQVNNLHLIRGMIGRPGAGIYQMNGQPTAQNTRETGADGDLPGLRNWDNPEHIAELARLWNVEPEVIPHWAPPTHAMQIFRYAEQGSVKLLWISATNPAVSLPDLSRIRRILRQPELFVVVQDLFLTETAELADVVLPAATWGEKTGTFTNVDRTVHLSEKAVDPPGEARADLDIFLDYARRMDFRDLDGRPLVKWTTPEEAFEAWQECSRGRPCDYTGLTYDRLRGGSGIQWPCNDANPDGTERLYADAVFPTDPAVCETYGQDLDTGAEFLADEYRAKQPGGRAFLHAVEYRPSPEVPDEEHPMLLTTGRTVYQFHTRTKTGRAPQLNSAAPDVWVELNPADAGRLGIAEGDLVGIASPRGAVQARARLSGIRPGVVFLPFHYGWFDQDPADRTPRAANELTITAWDPVSKQPLFKVAAVAVTRLADGGGVPAPAPTVGGSAPAVAGVPATVGGPAAEANSRAGGE
ncbi:molybdopterin oxidoreductase family protein [Micromonospora avicenniae]|uniref:Molydopterin dinucleotide binding domain-containing protein n=1 Tax=Micromonospora avicenniae TaxID=1198245 RepID=A0A1N6Z1D8_9ACTN|nr:nitrate reductase [Micromonospora avicenniae]SIR20620.1 Molydopterin dinucleotide binding domain-containing protein [Micromonospora avicenniae]